MRRLVGALLIGVSLSAALTAACAAKSDPPPPPAGPLSAPAPPTVYTAEKPETSSAPLPSPQAPGVSGGIIGGVAGGTAGGYAVGLPGQRSVHGWEPDYRRHGEKYDDAGEN